MRRVGPVLHFVSVDFYGSFRFILFHFGFILASFWLHFGFTLFHSGFIFVAAGLTDALCGPGGVVPMGHPDRRLGGVVRFLGHQLEAPIV
jgi:hypothetical protein